MYLIYAIAIASIVLFSLLVIICCYCMKEKGVHDEAKIYYYKNIQNDQSVL